MLVTHTHTAGGKKSTLAQHKKDKREGGKLPSFGHGTKSNTVSVRNTRTKDITVQHVIFARSLETCHTYVPPLQSRRPLG